ncbi:super-infection exclusion protein B [Geobacter sp. DSM 9736]|uniref:super-infection exclusion protein B n=1 Tax=Geobacter sp. DSM 9736 TaxID=1277350 RepID=UPI0012FDF5D4|nr:super-infection exclusion protein B [Geobacter sp. DSM 9736]
MKVTLDINGSEDTGMLKEALGNILDILKSPKLVTWIAISSAAVLYIPDRYAPFLIPFRESYGVYTTVTLVSACVYLLIDGVLWLINKVQTRRKLKKAVQRLLNRLYDLSYEEKIIMREFIFQDSKNIKFPIEQRVVNGLARDGLIQLVQRLPQFSSGSFVGVFRLTPTIDGLLTEEVVGLPVGEITREERQRIINERPYFVHKITERERIWEW